MIQSVFDLCTPFSAGAPLAALTQAMDAFTARAGFRSYCMIDATAMRTDQRCRTSDQTAFVRDYATTPKLAQDPLVSKSRRNSRTFAFSIDLWSTSAATGCPDYAHSLYKSGVHYGFSVPVHGPQGFRGHFAFGGTNPALIDPVLEVSVSAVGYVAFDALRDATQFCELRGVTLSPRERDTLCLAADGLTAWDIGERLSISVRTVEVYLRSACMKLGASTKTQAVANAIRCGLIR